MLASKIGMAGKPPLSVAIAACKRHFIGAAIFSAFSNLLYIAPTLYMLQVYNRVIPTGGVTTLVLLSLVTVVALALLGVLDWLRSRLMVRASAALDREIAGPILDAVLRQPGLNTMSRVRAMREFDHLRQSLSGAGLLALLDLPWTPIFLLLAFMMHPALAALGLAASALLLGLTLLNERATQAPIKSANEAASAAYAAQDYASASAEVIRALGMRQAMVASQLRERATMMDLQTRASFTASGYVALIKGLRLALQSAALGLGAYLAINGQLSAGAVFAASFLLTRMLAPIEQVVGAWKSLSLGQAAYKSLNSLLVAQPDQVSTILPAPVGDIRLEEVSVVAPSRQQLILNNIGFNVGAGQMIGVVGPSGAGKSTLARVMAGALRPERGQVRIDQASMSDWDEKSLAAHIGYMPQDFVLFAGTVKDNISRFDGALKGDPAAIDAAAVAAARSAGAHEMILHLPKGYDTVLGMNGAGLSSGQAQRIALARALYRDPRILILDEPNAHLDAEGEAHLVGLLGALKAQGRTIIIVAHRNTVLAEADRILVLKEGRIAAYGTMAEMLAETSRAMQAAAAAPEAPAVDKKRA